ncbi:MAG: GatB/YqeY domain-containing protein [candidate division Zixibacteria bacterium]|nr:GatB/YqeY domain-containing protein [candidate division Zixibacteria bacterium]
MDLKQRIIQDMKSAQKAGEKLKLSLTRLLKSDIQYKEIEKGEELSEEEILEVLSYAAKKHRDSIEQFKRGNREDLVNQEEEELKLILEYLPQQLNQIEIEKLVEEIISEVKAEGEKDIGKVMKALMPGIKGRADGKMVKLLVTNKLKTSQE